MLHAWGEVSLKRRIGGMGGEEEEGRLLYLSFTDAISFFGPLCITT